MKENKVRIGCNGGGAGIRTPVLKSLAKSSYMRFLQFVVSPMRARKQARYRND